MSAFPPIAPRRAIKIVEDAGVQHAAGAILDWAAAGLLRARALMIETTAVTGQSAEDSGAMPADLWKRFMRDASDRDAWISGVMRLPACELVGGAPAVCVTGIRFEVLDLHKLIAYHRRGTKPPAPKMPQPRSEAQADQPAMAERPRKPNASAIPSGALLVTVSQAMAALGFGRTKINELMNDGTLVRRHIGRSVRIEVDSIRALASEA